MHKITTAFRTRMAELDGLRGFAVLAVLFYHTLQVPSSGALGVDVFFTLSGFLISSQLFAEIDKTRTIKIGIFYLKRCARLIPAFVAACCLYYAITFCFPQSTPTESPLRLLSLLLTSNIYWARQSGGVQLLNHTWTLAVEWQFYLVWPLVLLGLSKAGLSKNGIAAFIVVVVLLVWLARWEGDNYMRFDGILIGSAIPLVHNAVLSKKLFAARNAIWTAFVPASIAIVALVFHPLHILTWESRPATSLLTAMIILFLILNGSSISTALLANRVVRHFGKISYGIYLYHFPIASLMYVNGFSPAKMLIVAAPVSIALAELSWRYLEEPIINVCARLIKTAKQKDAGAEKVVPS